MITLDGSQGEGGGQILRSALALSLVTGLPFRIEKIRARRRKPGLMRQHLTAVNAAIEIGAAKAEGNRIGSTELTFAPKTIKGGRYRFAIATAGSCTLVLQAVLPALCLAQEPSEIILEGGTHNPHAPPFDFLVRSFLPQLERMGPKVQAALEKPGFYPAGGGRMLVQVEPVASLSQIDLLERGEIIRREARASVAQLPRQIAERELRVVEKKLSWSKDSLIAEEVSDSCGPGNIITVAIASERVCEIFTGFGEWKVSAEKVAGQTVKKAQEYLAAEVPVGPYLADQLLLPMALAGGGTFRTVAPTKHTMTNIEVIKTFLAIQVSVEKMAPKVWEIQIKGDDGEKYEN